MVGDFVRIGGYINFAAGILLLLYWYAFAILLPYRELSSTLSILVGNRNWTWINTLGVIGALAGLLGQAGIYVAQITNTNGYVLIGFYVAITGTSLLIGTMLWDTILWPILFKYDRSLLDFQGPIYSSKTFLDFFILAGLIFAGGNILVGIGIVQAGLLPSAAGILIAVGGPAFGLGSLFGPLQVYPRTIGITLMCAGLIWLAFNMI